MAALKMLTPLALIALFVVAVRADDKKKEDKPAKAGYLGIKIDGGDGSIRISEVVGGGPAEKGGLKADDVVTKIDGKEVKDLQEFITAVRAHKPGDKISLTVKRGDKDMEIKITAGEAPDQDM